MNLSCMLFFFPPESCIVDSSILSALCLPPMDRVLIVGEQTEPDAESGLVYTVCSEMEVESENKEVFVEGAGNSDVCEQTQWFGISEDTKTEVVAASGSELAEGQPEGQIGTLMIGEDGQVTVLDKVEKKPGRRGRKKKCPENEGSGRTKKEDDPDFEVVWQRPVRKNRGLKMKGYLSQWRKTTRTPSTGSSSGSQTSDQSSDLDERTCKVCGLVVRQAKYLDRHMVRHSQDLPVSCPACARVFKSLRCLQQHRCSAQSTKKKPGRKPKVKESEVDKSTNSSSEVPAEGADGGQAAGDEEQDPSFEPSSETKASKDESQGETKGVLEGPFFCPHCSAEFKCKQTFRFHLRNICYTEQQVDPDTTDGVKSCFRCDECGKAFRYKSTLESHRQTHNPLYCEVCTKLVRDPEALEMHKQSHTPFQCNQCDQSFLVFKALHKHYIDVHNPSEPFTCTHCQTTFASLKRFIRHEWKHTGYQPFQCSYCTKRFRSYSDLVEHQKKHTKAYPYLCWECGKKFRHGVTLTRHVQRVHNTGEPISEKPLPTFTCAQCGKTFTSRRCLLKHDNFHHKGLRFPCEHCGKGFFGKDALVRHILIHTGERPFKCDDCEKSFRSSAELKIHRRYHTGERPFKCNICEKGFVQSCFLTLHMRTHTGERPYVCTVCNKGFSSLHGLKRHRRLVHA